MGKTITCVITTEERSRLLPIEATVEGFPVMLKLDHTISEDEEHRLIRLIQGALTLGLHSWENGMRPSGQ